MNRATRTKLARVLGVLGSEHAGERASAALVADRLVASLALTWREIIDGTPRGQVESRGQAHP